MFAQAGKGKNAILVLEASGVGNVKYYVPACEVLRTKPLKRGKPNLKRGEKTPVLCAKVEGDMLFTDRSGRNVSWFLLLVHLLF